MKVRKHCSVLHLYNRVGSVKRTLYRLRRVCVSSESGGIEKLSRNECGNWDSQSRADCLLNSSHHSPIIIADSNSPNHTDVDTRVLASSVSAIDDSETRTTADDSQSQLQLQTNNSNFSQSLTDGAPKKKSTTMRKQMKAVKELSKFNLSFFNAMVTGSTAFVSSGGLLYAVTIPATLGCMGLATAASALNQWQESEFDSQMHRTRLKRPLCSGRLTETQALMFVAVATTAGTGILATQCGSTAALIGLTTMITYNALYTPLKRITPYNTEFGAIVGALPPQIGIAASHFVQNPDYSMLEVMNATVSDPLCWFSLSLLFAWQMPHFMYISVRNRDDYIRGGFKMWSHSLYDDSVNTLCRRKSLLWSLTLPVLPTFLSMTGATSWMFALDGGVLSLAYVASVRRWQKDSQGNHSKMGKQSFMFNLIYLPAILALMAIHSQRWKYSRGDVIRTHMAWIQDKGISLCPWDNSQVEDSELPIEPVACTSPFRPELKEFHSESRKMYKVDSDGTVTQTRIS